MNKLLIVALSILIVFSLVFGMTYMETINFLSNGIDKSSSLILGLTDWLFPDMNIQSFSNYGIDYKYANLGTVNSFELGSIDIREYIVNNYMPDYFRVNIEFFNVDCKISPNYYTVSLKSSEDSIDDIKCIYYYCELSYDLGENAVGNWSHWYHVFVLSNSDYENYGFRYIVARNLPDTAITEPIAHLSKSYNTYDEMQSVINLPYKLNGEREMFPNSNVYYIKSVNSTSDLLGNKTSDMQYLFNDFIKE